MTLPVPSDATPPVSPDASTSAHLPWDADAVATLGPQLQREWQGLSASLRGELESVLTAITAAEQAQAAGPSVLSRVGTVVKPGMGTIALSGVVTGAALLGQPPSPDTLTQIAVGYVGAKAVVASVAGWIGVTQAKAHAGAVTADRAGVLAVRELLDQADAAVRAQGEAPADPARFAAALAAIGQVRDRVAAWRVSLRPALSLARQTREAPLSPARRTQYRQAIDRVTTVAEAYALDRAWREDAELRDRPDLIALRVELLAKVSPILVGARELNGPTSALPDIVQLAKGSLDRFGDPVPTVSKFVEAPEAMTEAEAYESRLQTLRFATSYPDAATGYAKHFLTVGSKLSLYLEHALQQGGMEASEAERLALGPTFGKIAQQALRLVAERGRDAAHGPARLADPAFFWALGSGLQDGRDQLAKILREGRRQVRVGQRVEDPQVVADWNALTETLARDVVKTDAVVTPPAAPGRPERTSTPGQRL